MTKLIPKRTTVNYVACLVWGLSPIACTSKGSFSQRSEAKDAGNEDSESKVAPPKSSDDKKTKESADAEPTPVVTEAAPADDSEELEDLEVPEGEPLFDDVDPNAPAPEDVFKQKTEMPPEEAPAPAEEAPEEQPKEDAPPPVTDINKWCKSAAEVKLMARPGLKSLHAELCDGDTAKALLKTTLIANAYAGNGTIQFTTLRALASDDDTEITSMRFAYAVKMPTTAKDYFDRALPKALEPAGLKAVVEGPGGTATVEVLESFANDGPHHVRGVLANQVLEKQVRGRNVTVESDTRSDQYMIEDGSLYMVTTTVMRAVSSIFSQDTLSALVKLDDQSYFITVVDAAVRNRGFSGIAESELARSSIAGAAAQYQRIVQNSMP